MKKYLVAWFLLAPMVGWAEPEPEERRLIEEIVVTAQRVEESAQDVPIGLSAFDETKINDQQIIGLTNVQLFAPNFSYTEVQAGGGMISIRGIGRLTSGSTATTTSVQAHSNDFPMLFPPLTDFNLRLSNNLEHTDQDSPTILLGFQAAPFYCTYIQYSRHKNGAAQCTLKPTLNASTPLSPSTIWSAHKLPVIAKSLEPHATS